MSVSPPWIFYIPTLLMVAFCGGAIIFASTRPSEYNRPKRYAIAALAIMMLSQFIYPFLVALLNGVVGGNALLASGIVGIVTTGAMMFSIALLITAVFIDRKPGGQQAGWDSGGTPLSDRPSENPYAAPRQ